MFLNCQIVEETKVFRQNANPPLHAEWILRDIDAAKEYLAGGGRYQTGEHFERRRFSGAVRAKKSANRTARDFEVEPVDGCKSTEALRKFAAADHPIIVGRQVFANGRATEATAMLQ